jgi:hypothetical protein
VWPYGAWMPPVRRAAPAPPFPPHVVLAVSRLARHIAADMDVARPRALVVGMLDWRTLTILDSAFSSVRAVPAPDGPELDSVDERYDVGVALDWLHRLEEPATGLAALRRVAPEHLLLGAPREPLARLGVTFTARLLRRPGRTSWSAPGFMRFASTAGAVRDVAHPFGWSLLWVRRY